LNDGDEAKEESAVPDAQERVTYDKLVRDRIPDIIHQAGGRCGVETLSGHAYRLALLDKLTEEAEEARTAGAAVGDGAGGASMGGLVAELADLQEVLDTVVAAYGLSADEVAAIQSARRTERGAFARRLRLLWTER
jgi:predicted house-cleaning noncanonical NTP pyrophosphatase (MazG superfamily)